MTKTDTLKITTPSDREIAMIRSFDAPRRLVFEAFIKPELIQRWLLGPEGWTMPICEVNATPGGTYRYVWRKPGKKDMATGGVFREVSPPGRIVCTEKFDDPWYEGESLVTTIFEEENGRTTVTQTMLFDTKETRDGVLKSGMESGVAVSYDRLAEILAQCE